jgi:hypothetical protein
VSFAVTIGLLVPDRHAPARTDTFPSRLRYRSTALDVDAEPARGRRAVTGWSRPGPSGDDRAVTVPARQIRAAYSAESITVYQAYPPAIARAAVAAGRFVPPFKPDRMTWIKPSFLWTMYRCGWAGKPGQEHVLAVEITRAGFEWALERACLSHFDPTHHPDRQAWARHLKASPVRVQWDPERSLRLGALPYRSLQVGLSGEAVDRYVNEWTVALTDVTPSVRTIHDLLGAGDQPAATALLPAERPYPLPAHVAAVIGASPA